MQETDKTNFLFKKRPAKFKRDPLWKAFFSKPAVSNPKKLRNEFGLTAQQAQEADVIDDEVTPAVKIQNTQGCLFFNTLQTTVPVIVNRFFSKS